MNIQRIHVESENPLHHWDWLNVKDQVVLDLGCGFHFIEDGWDTTPDFFLNKGAKKIIGVDPHIEDIEHFRSRLPDSEFVKDCVLSAEHLNQYLLNPEVQAVKMDIEGHERHLLETDETYQNIRNFAIETHNRNLFHDVMMKLIDCGFKITHVGTFYPRVYNECNLIFATRD